MSQISPKNMKAKVFMDEKLTTISYFDINNKEHQKLEKLDKEDRNFSDEKKENSCIV